MRGSVSDCVGFLLGADASKLYEVREVREKRSLTQNAYYWAMLNKLGRVLGMSDSELHLNMLREYGVCEIVSLSWQVPFREYFDYCDELGSDGGSPARRLVKVYKCSSRMNSLEFSRLIEGMREECEAQGIDVATPDEIARMRFTEPRKEEQ